MNNKPNLIDDKNKNLLGSGKLLKTIRLPRELSKLNQGLLPGQKYHSPSNA
jgi:hypothetical protein